MQCRACRAAEVVRRPVPRWKSIGLACLLAVPVQCRHCLMKFYVTLWRANRLPHCPESDGFDDQAAPAIPLVLPMAWIDLELRRAA